VGIGMIFPIVRLLQDDAFFADNQYIQLLANAAHVETAREMVIFACLGLIVLIVLKAVFLLSVQYWLSKILGAAEQSLALTLYDSYLRAPLPFMTARNSSHVLTNIYSLVGSVYNGSLLPAANILAEGVVLCGIVGALLVVDATAAIGSATLVTLFAVAYRFTFKNQVSDLSSLQYRAAVDGNKLVYESLGSVPEIKTFGREHFFVNSYGTIRKTHVRTSYLLKVLQLVPRHYVEILGTLGLSLFIYAAMDSRPTGELIALLALYGIAALRLMPSATRLITLTTDIQKAAVGVRTIESEVRALKEVNSWRGGRDLTERTIAPSVTYHLRDQIRIEEVSYRYEEDLPAINGISFTVKQGDSIGIVGTSGAGKSTLAQVLLGLLRPQSGRILMDGIVVDPMSNARQRSMSYVPQKLFLLDDTIRANIAFGVPTSEIDEQRLQRAIEKAELHEFVVSRPEGTETIVGERGVRLSGGQIQRLGIARAIYSDAEVIILDEATSALDVETEFRIASFLNGLRGERTLIVIAHRLSTIRQCDRILLIDSGQIVGEGSFDDLRKSNREFARMVELASLAPDEVIT
jgi:ATP-binding cassette subfamily C protein